MIGTETHATLAMQTVLAFALALSGLSLASAQDDLLLHERFTPDLFDKHLTDHLADHVDRLMNGGQGWVAVLSQGDIVKTCDGNIFPDN